MSLQNYKSPPIKIGDNVSIFAGVRSYRLEFLLIEVIVNPCKITQNYKIAWARLLGVRKPVTTFILRQKFLPRNVQGWRGHVCLAGTALAGYVASIKPQQKPPKYKRFCCTVQNEIFPTYKSKRA